MHFNNLYTLIAREISTDSSDNMISIIKIIDKFTFGYDIDNVPDPKAPKLFKVPYSIATSWQLDKKAKNELKLSVRLSLIDPGGTSLGGPTQHLTLPEGMNKINVNFGVHDMPATVSGMYSLRAELFRPKDNKVAEGQYSFEIEINDEVKQ